MGIDEGESARLRDELAGSGFAVVTEPVLGPRTLAAVRRRLRPLFVPGQVPPWLRKEIVDPRYPGHRAVEVITPSSMAPALSLRSEPIRTLRRAASDALGGPVRLVFDHAIERAAGCPTPTAWHQDSAYFDGPSDDPLNDTGRRVHIWMPLVDTTRETGGMRYLAGSHSRVLDHRPSGAHLEIDSGIGLGDAVHPSVPAGGFVLHHPAVVHGANPNSGPVDRVAWILHFVLDDRSVARRRFDEWTTIAEAQARLWWWRMRGWHRRRSPVR